VALARGGVLVTLVVRRADLREKVLRRRRTNWNALGARIAR
jgi:hypothetical protein